MGFKWAAYLISAHIIILITEETASKALDTQAYLTFLCLFVCQNEKARDISLSSSSD
ncbi:hypothetical protein YC2023_037706 [Brassica napus]